MIKKKELAISIAIPLAIGIISSLISNIASEFNTFNKPSFTPPAIVFPIVWTVLYILMGISSYIIYNSNDNNKKEALYVYGIQLIINGIWSFIFFKLQLFLLAFAVVVLLVILVIIMIKRFYDINKVSGLLQIPYLIWLILASILSASVYFLN